MIFLTIVCLSYRRFPFFTLRSFLVAGRLFCVFYLLIKSFLPFFFAPHATTLTLEDARKYEFEPEMTNYVHRQ